MQQPKLLKTVAVSTDSTPSKFSRYSLAFRNDLRDHSYSSILKRTEPKPQYASALSGLLVGSLVEYYLAAK